MANYIVPFVLGVFVGQEIQDVPRVKPYLQSAVNKVIQIGREIVANAQESTNDTKPSTKPTKNTPTTSSDNIFSRWSKTPTQNDNKKN